jgi:hypothetical protein
MASAKASALHWATVFEMAPSVRLDGLAGADAVRKIMRCSPSLVLLLPADSTPRDLESTCALRCSSLRHAEPAPDTLRSYGADYGNSVTTPIRRVTTG